MEQVNWLAVCNIILMGLYFSNVLMAEKVRTIYLSSLLFFSMGLYIAIENSNGKQQAGTATYAIERILDTVESKQRQIGHNYGLNRTIQAVWSKREAQGLLENIDAEDKEERQQIAKIRVEIQKSVYLFFETIAVMKNQAALLLFGIGDLLPESGTV